MRLFYLDSPNEIGSLAMLKQLQVSINPELPFKDFKSSDCLNKRHVLTRERKSNSPVYYKVMTGDLYVDVRDSADCWLRICLETNSVLSLPANLYHRFSHENIERVNVAVDFNTTDNYSSYDEAFTFRFVEEVDALTLVKPHRFRELICELCSQFYSLGWVTGTGGSISIRYGNRIFMTPSGVQKERILPDELFMLDIAGNILSIPPQKTPGKLPKLSDCSPLFLHSYRLRNAGAVLHSHDMTCVMVTAINPNSNEFRISHQEMIKGIAGYGYHDELVVPIIDNTAFESELADSLEQAIILYPKSYAVLVRDHGIYVWGDTWEQAKRHSECLHYLFNVAIQKHSLGLSEYKTEVVNGVDVNGNGEQPSKRQRTSIDSSTHACDACRKKRLSTELKVNASSYKYVVLDIEGTTTPITFVKDVLFPFARDNVYAHLSSTWHSQETQDDISALCIQAAADREDTKLPAGMPCVDVLIAHSSGTATHDTEKLKQCLCEYVRWNIAVDRKISSLKQLQGHIWATGYASGALKSTVYDDVPFFLSRMKRAGVHTCIYSSGSREAQKLLFKYSNFGDLRPMLSCYFDTKIGHKRDAESYKQIVQSLGVDSPDQVLFVTDIIEESDAAVEAGLHTVLSVRPGNAPLPSEHPYNIITSFDLM